MAPVFSCSPDNGGYNATDEWEHIIPDTPEPEPIPEDEPFFLTRGLVMGWSDVSNRNKIDYIKIAKENGINTFSIYNADRSSLVWKNFFDEAQKVGIQFEFQEHMMSHLLPRSLFSEHPEYFRMNQNGVRVADANGCPSSAGALYEVHKNAVTIGRNYKPTNNRYYFWLDDGGDICHCDNCKGYTASEQALIFENEIIAALKSINPDAMLAHLNYFNTMDAPKKVTPKEDIFLEFAPFFRSWSEPLSAKYARGRSDVTHEDYLRSLSENLKVFPASTAQVLEYWMDDSLFSLWDPNNLVKVPWNNAIFLDDLKTYASYGIRHITCYAAYVGPSYYDKFKDVSFLEEYGQGLLNYEKN